MKGLLCGLVVWLFLCGQALGGFLTEKVYTQVVSYSSVGTNAYSTDLGEIVCGPGTLVLWWVVESSASTDYDVHFFSEDNATWNNMIDTDEMIYQKETIATSWYHDDSLFPFVDSTTAGGNDTLYVGVYNDDNSNTSNFNVRVFFERRKGEQLTADTGN